MRETQETEFIASSWDDHESIDRSNAARNNLIKVDKITEVIRLRIAVASFSHETCTFCPNITTLEAWEEGGILYGKGALDTEGQGKSYITGYKEAAGEHEDVELVGTVRTTRPATVGMGSWLTTQAFDVISGRICDRISKAGELDGRGRPPRGSRRGKILRASSGRGHPQEGRRDGIIRG